MPRQLGELFISLQTLASGLLSRWFLDSRCLSLPPLGSLPPSLAGEPVLPTCVLPMQAGLTARTSGRRDLPEHPPGSCKSSPFWN